MPCRVLRTLVLLASLPLALPAGWCCMVRVVPARAGAVCPGRPMPCGCGCPAATDPQPFPSDDGTPRPRPLDPGKCCCSDRNTLKPKPADLPPPDLFVAAVLPLIADVAAAPAVAGLPHWSFHVPSPPVHVLLCVWLC